MIRARTKYFISLPAPPREGLCFTLPGVTADPFVVSAVFFVPLKLLQSNIFT